MEKQRQLVIFGDFRQIGFDVISKLPEAIQKKYNFIIDGQVDQPAPNPFPQIFMGQPQTRPVLKSGNLSIFLGLSRIHVQQDICTDEFSAFAQTALELLNEIVKLFTITTINRIAVNGLFEISEKTKIQDMVKKVIKDEKLFSDETYEFNFRINNTSDNKEINSKINYIYLYAFTPNRTMLVNFDINTIMQQGKNFVIDNLKPLIEIYKSQSKGV